MRDKTKIRLPISWLVIALILSFYILGFALYPYLPEKVPSHWDAAGQVNGYTSKTFQVIFFPSLILGIYVLMSFAPLIDPKPENYKKFIGVFQSFRIFMVCFMGVLYIATLLFAIGFPISIGKVVRIAIGIMLIFIGNYFGKIRHNFTFGIKTPWTLASEEVWNKTHRVSAPLWVVVGFIWILSIFLAERTAFWISMGALIIVSLYGTIYSYVLFRRTKKV